MAATQERAAAALAPPPNIRISKSNDPSREQGKP